jgi:N-acetyl sugar amidotransferase
MFNIKVCTRCIMDTTDRDIVFDENGICNHCLEFDANVDFRVLRGEEGRMALQAIVEKIKSKGKGKEYDCIVGVSGGVDSTYVAYKCRQLGLRPLAVHLDNGWNSELAVSNIERVIKKLDFDLYTYVLDWREFKDLQLSFLKASTPDGEVPTDHAIFALLLKVAREKNISYIMNGMNYLTEASTVPSWSYGHGDWNYIKYIQKTFGKAKLNNYPHYTTWDMFYMLFVKKLKFVSILNYIDYNKDEAIGILEKELGWQYYGGKHHESSYTKFFQAFILPSKFSIDKRKIHLSNSIQSGHISREFALNELDKPIYSQDQLDADKEFVAKKLAISIDKFEEIMSQTPKYYTDYPNSSKKYFFLKNIQYTLRKLGLFHK